MAWLLLAGAIVTEVVATTALKLSAGLTRLVPALIVVSGYVLSFVLLAWALRLQLQVSVAYAVWSGLGTAAIAVIGAIWLGEPLTPIKIVGIGLVIAGAVVLNLADTAHGG